MLASFLISGVSLTHPVLVLWIFCSSFSYTSHAGFIFIRGVSDTHPVLVSFLFGEFLLHIPCCLHFYLGSFSYTYRAGFIFYLGSFSYTSRAGFMYFLFLLGFFLTHPVLASVLSGEFL